MSLSDNLQFIIDNRERKVIDCISKKNIEYKLTNLNIGDYIFAYNPKEDNPQEDNPKVIIERKTVDDLASSIKDGRYKEQKIRLLNEQNNGHQIIYIIEGNIYNNVGKISSKTFNSVIVNGIIRDGIYTYISKDIEDTINFLIKSFDMINKTGKIWNRFPINNQCNENNISDKNNKLNENNIEYGSHIKSVKKDNLTPKVCFIHQLSQIPGVSVKIATAISDKFNSITELIHELEIDEGESVCEIKYGKTQRKIGPVISKRLYDFMK